MRESARPEAIETEYGPAPEPETVAVTAPPDEAVTVATTVTDADQLPTSVEPSDVEPEASDTGAGVEGQYNVIYEFREESVGLAAGEDGLGEVERVDAARGHDRRVAARVADGADPPVHHRADGIVERQDLFRGESGNQGLRMQAGLEEDLVSAESYGDFELAFDWKISERGNTGIKYRIQDFSLTI